MIRVKVRVKVRVMVRVMVRVRRNCFRVRVRVSGVRVRG